MPGNNNTSIHGNQLKDFCCKSLLITKHFTFFSIGLSESNLYFFSKQKFARQTLYCQFYVHFVLNSEQNIPWALKDTLKILYHKIWARRYILHFTWYFGTDFYSKNVEKYDNIILLHWKIKNYKKTPCSK